MAKAVTLCNDIRWNKQIKDNIPRVCCPIYTLILTLAWNYNQLNFEQIIWATVKAELGLNTKRPHSRKTLESLHQPWCVNEFGYKDNPPPSNPYQNDKPCWTGIKSNSKVKQVLMFKLLSSYLHFISRNRWLVMAVISLPAYGLCPSYDRDTQVPIQQLTYKMAASATCLYHSGPIMGYLTRLQICNLQPFQTQKHFCR